MFDRNCNKGQYVNNVMLGPLELSLHSSLQKFRAFGKSFMNLIPERFPERGKRIIAQGKSNMVTLNSGFISAKLETMVISCKFSAISFVTGFVTARDAKMSLMHRVFLFS